LREWLAKYEQARNERLDRLDDYLKELHDKESGSGTQSARVGSHRVPERSRDCRHPGVRRSGVTKLTYRLAFRDKASRDHMTRYDGLLANFDHEEDLLRSLLDPNGTVSG
jgi:hypothetical protein